MWYSLRVKGLLILNDLRIPQDAKYLGLNYEENIFIKSKQVESQKKKQNILVGRQ